MLGDSVSFYAIREHNGIKALCVFETKKDRDAAVIAGPYMWSVTHKGAMKELAKRGDKPASWKSKDKYVYLDDLPA